VVKKTRLDSLLGGLCPVKHPAADLLKLRDQRIRTSPSKRRRIDLRNQQVGRCQVRAAPKTRAIRLSRKSHELGLATAHTISVLSSVNLLHVEEYKEKVQAITGKNTTQTIPKSFLLAADDIVIVDVPPDLCLSRQGEKLTSTGISNSQERQLSELRELALLLTAEVVDAQLETYVHAHGIEPVFGTHERFLVCMTPHSNALAMIESGNRNKERFQGDLYAVYVCEPGRSKRERVMIRRYFDAAKKAGASTEVLESNDPISAIVEFARQKRITQIFIGHSDRNSWRDRVFGDPVLRLIRAAEGIDVRVFPH
jgi:two-component system sensor histidine kinase KdpD